MELSQDSRGSTATEDKNPSMPPQTRHCRIGDILLSTQAGITVKSLQKGWLGVRMTKSHPVWPASLHSLGVFGNEWAARLKAESPNLKASLARLMSLVIPLAVAEFVGDGGGISIA